jgi:hypothetical protein
MPEPKLEKAEYYRGLALDLQKQAQAASMESTKSDLLNLAQSWLELARRAELLEKSKH